MITALCLSPLAIPAVLVGWLLCKGAGAWLRHCEKKFDEKYPFTSEE